MKTRTPWPTRNMSAMKEATAQLTDKNSLVDINSVHVDEGLPQNERIAEFVRQIKNPYCFKCGEFTVLSKYVGNGVSLEDCLLRILR